MKKYHHRILLLLLTAHLSPSWAAEFGMELPLPIQQAAYQLTAQGFRPISASRTDKQYWWQPAESLCLRLTLTDQQLEGIDTVDPSVCSPPLPEQATTTASLSMTHLQADCQSAVANIFAENKDKIITQPAINPSGSYRVFGQFEDIQFECLFNQAGQFLHVLTL